MVISVVSVLSLCSAFTSAQIPSTARPAPTPPPPPSDGPMKAADETPLTTFEEELRAKRAIKLNVSAPFHCALMMPAQDRLENHLAGLQYTKFEFPIVHNVDAAVNADETRVADVLTRQVSSPVKWLQSLQNLIANGTTTFVEIGPGKVLSGLTKQIDRDVRILNVENVESLRNTQETL